MGSNGTNLDILMGWGVRGEGGSNGKGWRVRGRGILGKGRGWERKIRGTGCMQKGG